MSTDAAPALALQNVSKRFGRVAALQSASLGVRPNTVHALLGENGAGKTTLMRIAFGLLQPDAGSIHRAGAAVKFSGPGDAIAAGIGMVHQHFSLVPGMTVAENLSLGRRGRFSRAAAAVYARTATSRFGLLLDPHARVADLSVAEQQRVEIANALLRSARVLILDEPTAVLAPPEATELLEQLRTIASQGTAVVLITHKLADALRVADDVTVLRGGATVYSAPAANASVDVLVTAMLGERPPLEESPRVSTQHRQHREDILATRGVSVAAENGVLRLADANLSVRSGEILGVAGVEGSGQRELLRVLAGRLLPASGHVVHPATVGFVPEDRHRDALILDFSLLENVALAGAATRSGAMPWHALDDETRSILGEYAIAAGGSSAPARSLSGGNQQRFVVGRELRRGSAAIVIENPTRGLDVHATARVHHALRTAAASGAAVVVYSGDIDELVSLAHRVVVCFATRVYAVSLNADAIGRAMVGTTEASS
jgi:simple sugar transport system ATP-binding protein